MFFPPCLFLGCLRDSLWWLDLRLCEEVRKLQEERRKLHEEVTRDTAFLGKLPDLLDSLFRAALPLQEYFAAPSSTTLDGVPVTESQVEGVEEDQLSLLLPKPLYTLYYQALNFQHTFGLRGYCPFPSFSLSPSLSHTPGSIG